MAKRVCGACHDHFYVDEARANTDDYYGPGRYQWACDWSGCLLCENCARQILHMDPQLDADGNEYEVDPEDIIYPGLND